MSDKRRAAPSVSPPPRGGGHREAAALGALFVYYKLAPAQLAATVASVRALQRALRQAHAGLHADVLRRPGLQDGQVTLMETYAGTLPPDLAATLTRAAQRSGWAQPRHAEWFEPLD